MGYTTGDAVRDILSELGQLTEGVATGGTTASVVDTLLGGTDDDWNGGTVIITRNVSSAATPPEGQFGIVTDYTASTAGISVAAGTFTTAPAAGDIYGVSTSYYPLRQVIRGLNRALSAMGDIPLTDIATLTTAVAQTEYTYAVAWKRRPPFRVDIQGKLDDTNDYQWKEINWWEYVPATAGSTGLLILKQQPPTGYLLRIWYLSPHPNVEAYSDIIYEGFHPELVVWKSVYEVLIWQHGRSQGTDASVVQMLNKAEQQIFKLDAVHKPWMPKRKTKLLILTGQRDKDEFTAPS